MSTRCNIIVKDKYNKLYFYRHSDGYPEGAMPLLEKFLSWVKSGKIRNNIGQASGWLIVLGALEYQTIPKCLEVEETEYSKSGDVSSIEEPEDWKCGSIEPTNGIHGDVEYIYTVDLDKKEITYKEA